MPLTLILSAKLDLACSIGAPSLKLLLVYILGKAVQKTESRGLCVLATQASASNRPS